MPIRTLVVDDEPLAIERLQILCAQLPEVAIVGTASDGEAALRLISALRPELVLLDIAMPGLDGLAVANAIEHQSNRPAVVFCTAFSEHAVAAFDLSAVDYLLKPVSADRLRRAVTKVRTFRATTQAETVRTTPFLEYFWVPDRHEMVRIAAIDIDWIEAERDYMRLHVGKRSHLLHQTISALERQLNPKEFLRVHRSTIVRRRAVAKLRRDQSGSLFVILGDGREIRVARRYLTAARELAASKIA